MTNTDFLGKNLRRIRKQKNLTVESLAEKAGISPGYLSDIEHNKKPPSLSVLISIANALDTTTDMLLYDVLDQGAPAYINDFAKQLSELTPGERKTIVNLLTECLHFVKSINDVV